MRISRIGLTMVDPVTPAQVHSEVFFNDSRRFSRLLTPKENEGPKDPRCNFDLSSPAYHRRAKALGFSALP